MQKGLISIILPAYNAERYIAECINSVLEQSYKEWELILIDDGSKDATERIATSYAKEHDRIKYHRLNNGGVSNARNVGLEVANGEYIFFLDADDYLEKGCLKKAIMASEAGNADIVVVAHNEVNELDKHSLQNNKFQATEALVKENIVKTFLMTDKIGWEVWGKLYKRTVIDEIQFEKDMRIAEDAVFLFKALFKCEKIVLLKEYGYNYRINMGSVMVQSFNEKNLDIIKAIAKMEGMAKTAYPFEATAFKLKYYIWFLRRYNCKITKEEISRFHEEIVKVRNAIKAESISNAFAMLSKKYAVEFIMIKYFYCIYRKFIKLLYKCK